MQNKKKIKQDDVSKFYSYGCYKSNASLNGLTKKFRLIAGDGIIIDKGVISIDEEYISKLEQLACTDWKDINTITGDDVDTCILEVEDETNYGMAKAMGVE